MCRRRFAVVMAGVTLAVIFGLSACAGGGARVARWTGARGGLTNALSSWNAANTAIGPLRTDRVFYQTLPSNYWADRDCSGLPAKVMCIVSYKTPTTNVAAYVKSIPSGRPVIMVFYHEPEGGGFSTGSAFVTAFEAQSNLIRAAAGRSNIQVAMVAGTSRQYANRSGRGWDCSYIPSARYVNHYFADIYDPTGDLLENDPGFTRWRYCTAGRHRSRGITEWGIGPTRCITSGLTRAEVMARDEQWLLGPFPLMYLLEYWWVDNSATGGACADWKFSSPAEVSAWKSARG
jgi:hypothetical protein